MCVIGPATPRSGIHVRAHRGGEDDIAAGNEPIVDVDVRLADLEAHEIVYAEPQRLYPYRLEERHSNEVLDVDGRGLCRVGAGCGFVFDLRQQRAVAEVLIADPKRRKGDIVVEPHIAAQPSRQLVLHFSLHHAPKARTLEPTQLLSPYNTN